MGVFMTRWLEVGILRDAVDLDIHRSLRRLHPHPAKAVYRLDCLDLPFAADKVQYLLDERESVGTTRRMVQRHRTLDRQG
jgi:hypothetical protein